ncbi:MAG: phytanoyl-CoA dioxygenase family protein [Planctomycetota bacterium]|nr:phytanoyl-CoA dioxygenase family protein [Planctomycetota bacterium]MDA1142150.1 phytanoyl-CoA dioxygenase family protein [Planctomycetota bacterium]
MNDKNSIQDFIPMTDEQKFFFDLRGWLLLPSVLNAEEIDVMKAEVYSGAKNSYEGLQSLLDHPSIVGILNELLTEQPFAKEECYGFRCEGSFTTIRKPGWNTKDRSDGGMPHVVRPPQQANAMRYQVAGKKIFSGLTRVVWELEEVKAGQGGTSFLSGSHKAHFNYGGPNPYAPNIGGSPWEESMRAAMEDYSCPAGSVVIFTESLVHAANDWTNPDNPRCAVFNCYNSIWAQWHKLNLSHEIIEAMPPKRRSLFRGTWAIGGGPNGNREYSLENRSL